jgi:hypothetical protein
VGCFDFGGLPADFEVELVVQVIVLYLVGYSSEMVFRGHLELNRQLNQDLQVVARLVIAKEAQSLKSVGVETFLVENCLNQEKELV